MAYFTPGKNDDGESASYQVKWRLGGGRTAPQQTERVPPTEEGQAAAGVFKEAVNEHEVNHWGQWASTSEAIHLGIELKACTLCYAFTQQWLRPILESEGTEDWHRWLVGYDTSPLRVRTNCSGTALQAYERGVISATALRRETGFDESDAPSAEEKAARDKEAGTTDEGTEATPPPEQRAAAHTAAPGRRAPPPVTDPDPSAAQAPGLVGPCAHCRRPTHTYGRGGRPLCQWCMAPVLARYGNTIRYVSARS